MDIIEFKILNTAIERILNQEMSELNITYTQATIIGYLDMNREKNVCQRDIERALGVTHPTMSSILGRLEKNGLIVTKPFENDKRYKMVILTEKSSEMVSAIKGKIAKIAGCMFAGLSEKEKKELSKIIGKLIKNITQNT